MPAGVSTRSAAITSLVGLALAALVWFETETVRRTTSPTYDEAQYMQMAFQVRSGNFLPLVRAGTAPLPVLLDVVGLEGYRLRDMDTSDLRKMVRRVRTVHVALIGIPLVILVYLWLLERRGRLVAGCAAGMLALSPTFLAHASIATTDAAMAFWSVVTLAALAWHHHRKQLWLLIVVALALGMAFGAKYSAICLLPAVLVSLGWWRGPLVIAGASVVVYALHGFFELPLLNPQNYVSWIQSAPAREHWLEVAKHTNLPAPLAGTLHQWMHQRGGADSFFLGTRDSSGWWSYFPIAISLKSTPAELAAILCLPVCLFVGWRRRDHAFKLWAITLAAFAFTLIVSRVNIGVRYALPLYPLAALCVADVLPLVPLRSSVAAAVAVTALAVQAFSSVTVAPHYLSYFNTLAGGPAGGYRYLSDSNLDWGQDLPSLAEEYASLGRPRLCVAYFGRVGLMPYGIAASDWHNADKCREADWFAISVTFLQVSYIDRHPFAPLLAEPPDCRAAYSIYLYDMKRPEVRAVLENAWSTLVP